MSSLKFNELPEDEEIIQALVHPFEAVSQLFPDYLLTALVPMERYDGYAHIHCVTDDEMQETCEFVNSFNSMLATSDDIKVQARIKILVYSHIMESDYPLVVYWNLLNVLNNQPCNWTVTRVTKEGKTKVCSYTTEKIVELKELADRVGLPLGSILEKLWNNDLRNTFNHSQYTFMAHLYAGTRHLSPFSRKNNKSLYDADVRYSLDYIDSLYQKACGYLEIFVKAHKHYIAPFLDGESHSTQLGEIFWDSDVNRWRWSEHR